MSSTQVLIPALLLALAASTPLAAQQAAKEPAEPQAQGTLESGGPAAASPGESKPAPEKTDDSPFDYRSSEEISEDLSVSFPVDI